MTAIRFRDASKVFLKDTQAIQDLSLKIEERELFVITGPEGCGKSTVLRIISGQETLSQGNLYLNGELANRAPPKARSVAMVFPSYALFAHINIYKNLAFGLELRELPEEEVEERVREVARSLKISALLDRKPKTLTPDEAQQVAFGRALILAPDFYLLDDPLAGLDTKARVQTAEKYLELHSKLNKTFVYATPDSEEALTLGDRVAVMNKGRLIQVDTPQNLCSAPHNLFVARFLGEARMTLLDATLKKDVDGFYLDTGVDRLELPAQRAKGRLADHLDRPLKIGIPAGQMHTEADFISKNPRAVLNTTADLTEVQGSAVRLSLKYEGIRFSIATSPESTVKAGTPVQVGLEVDKLSFFDLQTELAL